jgi:hypothetical protein
MRERILAVYHTLLAALTGYIVFQRRGVDIYGITTVVMLAFVAYVKWEEYFRQRRDRAGKPDAY